MGKPCSLLFGIEINSDTSPIIFQTDLIHPVCMHHQELCEVFILVIVVCLYDCSIGTLQRIMLTHLLNLHLKV